jgi:hypothetical protein
VGLTTADIVAFVTMIATAATAAVALIQAVQNAHSVNNLTTNVTYALEAQVQIDADLMFASTYLRLWLSH